MGYADPDVAREKNREYMRLHRETRKKFHLCVNCKTQDAYTLAGHQYCADCNERNREYNRISYERHAAEHNEKSRERRDERRKKHLCTSCGKKLPKGDTHVLCARCRAVGREKKARAQIWDGRMDRETMRAAGLCVRCGAPRKQGETAWSGREILLCERCYAQSCESLQKARAAYLEKYGRTWGETQSARERAVV